MCGRGSVALLLFAGALGAQPAAVLEDLRLRAVEALKRIPRAENWTQASAGQSAFRDRLRRSLHLDSMSSESARAFVYEPPQPQGSGAAVVLIRPHEDPSQIASQVLPFELARLGFLVIEVDAFASHGRFDGLLEGVVPQTLVQAGVEGALAYLRSRKGIDSTRIGLVGSTISTTIAAALQREFAAIAVLDGAPDFAEILSQPETCALVPGLLRFAATEDLFDSIAPRPILLMNASPKVVEYARELYRGAGAVDAMRVNEGKNWDQATRTALSDFLRNALGRTKVQDASETKPPSEVALRMGGAKVSAELTVVNEQVLASMYGASLPEGQMTLALNCKGDHDIDFFPQSGIRAPVTALRPGPTGCDPSRGNLIAVDDRGRSALVNDDVVREANRRGWIVWMLDPRHIGELDTKADLSVFGLSLLLGENATWRQAADILRVVRHVGGMHSRDPTMVYARGKNMALAASYLAAVASRREVQWVVLRDAAATWTDLADVPALVIPVGARRLFAISDLWKAATANLVRIEDVDAFIRKDW